MTGATGTLLVTTLEELRSLAERTLPEIRLAYLAVQFRPPDRDASFDASFTARQAAGRYTRLEVSQTINTPSLPAPQRTSFPSRLIFPKLSNCDQTAFCLFGILSQQFTGEDHGTTSRRPSQESQEHHEKAAHQHKAASKGDEANQHEKAAHHAHLAHGDSQQPIHHGTAAAKSHVEHHGNKSRSRQ